MSEVRQIEWESCLVEPRRDPELERYVRKHLGMVPHAIPYFAPCPWIVRNAVEFNHWRLPLVYVDFDFVEIVSLIVSQENSCRYCYAATRALMRILGFEEQRIQRLEQDILTAELSPKEKLALEFVRRVSRSNPMPTLADFERLRAAGYDEAEVKEIVFLVGVNIFYNRASTLAAIPPAPMEAMPERWWVKLGRPVLAWKIRSRRRRGKPERLSEELKNGPFSYIVEAFDGLPIAKSLHHVLRDAWTSTILNRKTKALIFAVVARGLGCSLSEQEATRLLQAEGLSATEVAEILTHLASPKLDRIESLAVPFARETIWYRPAQIQRRAREVRKELSLEQFLELVGTASLANTVCRMSIAVVRH